MKVVPRLRLHGISKAYPGVLANDRIDLAIRPGEIHALLGENGAGKSTLVKIIYGVVRPDAGRILWEGRPLSVASPREARRLGIGMVFQHFSLFETLTVAENIALGVEGKRRQLSQRITEVAARYGLDLDPTREVHTLGMGERQRVEIVRCLLQQPKLLIMDEPTSVLTPQATVKLFETLRQLATEGTSILFISHKLQEIQDLCETATVLRQGRVSATCDPGSETSRSLARMMIGGDLPEVAVSRMPTVTGEERLRVNHLSLPAHGPFGTPLEDIHFSIQGGEILGLAGVAGNGQRELLAALSGEYLNHPDTIWIGGEPAGDLGPAARRRQGLAVVPEERLGRGAVPEMSLVENTLLTSHYLVRGGFIRFRALRRLAERIRVEFRVAAGSTRSLARSLSGGNLQKFILGREILHEPQLLVAAHPTWGVDVGAAAAIHRALLELRERGAALLVISEDLDELLTLSDRIGVLYRGRLSPVRQASSTTVEEIGLWMGGRFEEEILNPVLNADGTVDYAPP